MIISINIYHLIKSYIKKITQIINFDCNIWYRTINLNKITFTIIFLYYYID